MELTQTAETPYKLSKLAKCAHEGCSCTVASGEEFCSDYCAAQVNGEEAAAASDKCMCGHPECTPAAASGAPPASAAGPFWS